ncbi:MAG: OsmC family protein [Anaerolineae bacterium]
MAEVKVQWIGGERFVGIDSTQHSVVMSTLKEGVGMRPSEMLLVAVGACSAVDVVGILQKKRLDLRALDIKVTGEQDADPPWTYRKIHVNYTLRGKGLTDKAVEQAITLSEEKYCSVSTTVRGVAAITHSYQILEE